jgi:hypothetical protein
MPGPDAPLALAFTPRDFPHSRVTLWITTAIHLDTRISTPQPGTRGDETLMRMHIDWSRIREYNTFK